ncbi:hypothetical protein BRADI_2g17802v3 [Brachypodium distachyon]|uniref:Uncharacterized protein n=1 Tax=Brachypodium distachyon TaxID=15368 RepID=A0A0Q3G0L4_BRADI|nr:hypothetical protein BRADI_2g17802v3 [Brachypodium distachyon]
MGAASSDAETNTSIQPSSESQSSGRDDAGQANALILSAVLCAETSSSSSSSSASVSQNAASSVLFGDTHSRFASLPAADKNGCSSSCAAVHRSPGRLTRHLDKKSLASAPILCSAASTPSSSMPVPFHGARPVAISTTVHPSAHMSAAGPCSSPRATSGAMNAGVPPRMGAQESAFLEQPKSASLAQPSPPITTFLGFTSPWTSPAPWRYASPVARSAAYARTALSSSLPPSASEPPGANSRKSWTLGERSPAMIPCSLLKAAAAPMAAADADLTANSSPDASSAARNTSAPDAPRPSVRTRVHCLLLAAIAIFFNSF